MSGINLLNHVQDLNCQTCKEMDAEAEGNKTCGAPHRSLVNASKRIMGNQEFMIASILSSNGNGNNKTTNGNGTKTVRLGPFKMEGVTNKDIAKCIGSIVQTMGHITIFLVVIWVALLLSNKLPDQFKPSHSVMVVPNGNFSK